MPSREVDITIWGPHGVPQYEDPILHFTYTEGDADEMEFEEWRSTRLEKFIQGLASLMEEHDFITLERTK